MATLMGARPPWKLVAAALESGDLLLRAQEGEMELPDVEPLLTQLISAGLIPGSARQIAPGSPLMAVTARLET